MTPSRRAEPVGDSPDWSTDALTGLIPPRSTTLESLPAAPAVHGKPVRAAIYVLLGLIATGGGFALARRAGPPVSGAAEIPSAPSSTRSADVVATGPPPRSTIVVRAVRSPTPKAAAAAFARGDYTEALAQYRALAALDPQQTAYQSLVRVLERRLAPKAATE